MKYLFIFASLAVAYSLSAKKAAAKVWNAKVRYDLANEKVGKATNEINNTLNLITTTMDNQMVSSLNLDFGNVLKYLKGKIAVRTAVLEAALKKHIKEHAKGLVKRMHKTTDEMTGNLLKAPEEPAMTAAEKKASRKRWKTHHKNLIALVKENVLAVKTRLNKDVTIQVNKTKKDLRRWCRAENKTFADKLPVDVATNVNKHQKQLVRTMKASANKFIGMGAPEEADFEYGAPEEARGKGRGRSPEEAMFDFKDFDGPEEDDEEIEDLGEIDDAPEEAVEINPWN